MLALRWHIIRLGFLLILFSTVSIQSSFAQDYQAKYEQEFELWLVTEAQYKYNRKSRLKWQHQIRIDEDGLDQFLHQMSYSYKFWKRFETNVGIRLISDFDELLEVKKAAWRLHGDISHKWSFKNLAWENRLRFQMRNQFKNIPAKTRYHTRDIRLKSELHFECPESKLTPYLGIELFYHNEYRELDGFTKYRWLVGSSYRLNKSHRFQFQFINELETKIWEPKSNNILRIKYSCRI